MNKNKNKFKKKFYHNNFNRKRKKFWIKIRF